MNIWHRRVGVDHLEVLYTRSIFVVLVLLFYTKSHIKLEISSEAGGGGFA